MAKVKTVVQTVVKEDPYDATIKSLEAIQETLNGKIYAAQDQVDNLNSDIESLEELLSKVQDVIYGVQDLNN